MGTQKETLIKSTAHVQVTASTPFNLLEISKLFLAFCVPWGCKS